MTADRGAHEAGSHPQPTGSPAVAVLLAWLVPGLGHVYLKRWRRGLAFLVLLSSMFAVGLLLEGSLSSFRSVTFLGKLATLADMGLGAPFAIAKWLGFGTGRVTAATHEIGNAFHWSAGVLNMLLVLDALDVARGRK